MKNRKFLQNVILAAMSAAALNAAAFTPMVPVTGAKILNLPANQPGGNFGMSNLFDGKLKSEYASHDEGTNTMVSLEFPQVTRISAVRHLDRNDRATVAKAELDFRDANNSLV